MRIAQRHTTPSRHILHFSLLFENTEIAPHRLFLKELKFTGMLLLNSYMPIRLLQLQEELLLLSHQKGGRGVVKDTDGASHKLPGELQQVNETQQQKQAESAADYVSNTTLIC